MLYSSYTYIGIQLLTETPPLKNPGSHSALAAEREENIGRKYKGITMAL